MEDKPVKEEPKRETPPQDAGQETPGRFSGSNMARIWLGVILILLGGLFLVGQLCSGIFHFNIGQYTWPLVIIVPGALIFFGAFTLSRQAGLGLAIFGSIVTMTGAILLVQNTFDVFASWSYAWALVAPTSVGLAMLIYGSLRGMKDQVRAGWKLTQIGLILFLVGGFFFEIIIGVSGFDFGPARLLWPLGLIVLGVILLLANLLPRLNRSAK